MSDPSTAFGHAPKYGGRSRIRLSDTLEIHFEGCWM
jgi:hypothetical protein